MIIKSYTNIGILFIPHQFFISGWLFMTLCVIVSVFLNVVSYTLLIEVNDTVGGSMSHMVERILGKRMRVICEIQLAIT